MKYWFLSVALFLSLVACQASPAEVYQEAKLASQAGDWDIVLSHFDQKTRTVLKGLDEIREETSRRLDYPLDIQSLHTWGELLSEEIERHRALLRVGSKRRPKEVAFVSENGEWKIRGIHLSTFWKKP